MEIRNIVLELGVDKYGEPLFCKEAKNEIVEVENSWYSYSALSYADSYINEHADATTVLHIAYDDSRGMVLHMKVKDRDNVSTVVYDSKGAEKELFMLRNKLPMHWIGFFEASMKRGKEGIKKDIMSIESDISALQKEISDLVAEMTKLSEAL